MGVVNMWDEKDWSFEEDSVYVEEGLENGVDSGALRPSEAGFCLGFIKGGII